MQAAAQKTKEEIIVEEVIIIGSGCAGLSAAIYTAREGFSPLVIAGRAAGGQLMLTTKVENYPGFPQGVDGPELVGMMKAQAERFGARMVYEDVASVDFSGKPLKVTCESNAYDAKAVIIATGAYAMLLGIPSESKYMGHGVSTCGTCDGPFFKGRDVVVVGGGDTAMEDAHFLTKFASSITLVHRRADFRASRIMQDKVLSDPKIKAVMETVVEEILGDGRSVTGVRLRNVRTDEITEKKAQGVFITIGYSPNTKFLNGQVKTDGKGYISSTDEVLTSVEGVFVAGDVSDSFYRQAATASGSGVKAALRAREYLQGR